MKEKIGMENIFYIRLLFQLVITGIVMCSVAYDAEHCMLSNELTMSKTKAELLGGMFPIPMIIGFLGDDITNKNCD